MEVEVSCVFVWGAGKSFRVEQEIRMTDGTLAAEIPTWTSCVAVTDRACTWRHDPGVYPWPARADPSA